MIQTNDIGGRLALDARSLDALRLQAKQNPEQALKGVSQQFEAVFLQTLLKSMRDATPQDGPLDSEQTRMYTAMLDQQMAQSLSARGIGLAEVMLRQLTHNHAATGGASATAPAAGANAPAAAAVPAPQSKPGDVEIDGLQQGQDFLLRMKDHALEASNASGIPARFLLGQAALESGWGKHEIRAADGSQSFNLFGIKAGRSWKGATVDVMTTEYVDGAPHKMVQKFRAYGSYGEGFQDYAALMQGNRRYAEVLKQRDSAGFAQGLQRAGYATDPRYADKLTSILNGPRMRQAIVA
jgi:flagellar protein FlgJ